MRRPTHVYFIKPIGLPGPIKIGCSWNPVDRMKMLMAWSPYPLEIIIAIPGSYKLEKNLHDCFADLYSHREWFNPGPTLLEAIEQLKAGKPVEQAVDLSKRVGSITKGKCGGANWSALTRQKMSVLTRIRHALKRIGVDHQNMGPAHIKRIQRISETRILQAEEMAALQAFCENPHPYADECMAEYLPWKQRQEEWKRSRGLAA